MNSINITLNKPDYPPLFTKGQLIRIAKKKRVWGEVENDSVRSNGETKVTIKSVYRPSPKSTLNKKRIFSKFKRKIIPMTTP